MYWYLTIRPDAAYSRSVAACEVVRLLAMMSELRQSGPASFEAAPGLLWVSAVVAEAGPSGNYQVHDSLPSSVNVVELICSTSEDPAWYDDLAGRIAKPLGWEAIEVHEGRRVWPPNSGNYHPRAVEAT